MTTTLLIVMLAGEGVLAVLFFRLLAIGTALREDLPRYLAEVHESRADAARIAQATAQRLDALERDVAELKQANERRAS